MRKVPRFSPRMKLSSPKSSEPDKTMEVKQTSNDVNDEGPRRIKAGKELPTTIFKTRSPRAKVSPYDECWPQATLAASQSLPNMKRLNSRNKVAADSRRISRLPNLSKIVETEQNFLSQTFGRPSVVKMKTLKSAFGLPIPPPRLGLQASKNKSKMSHRRWKQQALIFVPSTYATETSFCQARIPPTIVSEKPPLKIKNASYKTDTKTNNNAENDKSNHLSPKHRHSVKELRLKTLEDLNETLAQPNWPTEVAVLPLAKPVDELGSLNSKQF